MVHLADWDSPHATRDDNMGDMAPTADFLIIAIGSIELSTP